MKNKLIALLALVAFTSGSQAAVTFTIAGNTGTANGPNGLPVVDSTGSAILNSTNSVFISIGYLTAGGDSTAASVLSRFVPVDSSPVTPTTGRNGIFNANDYSNAANVYPVGFQGQTAVMLIGNNSTIANSTAIAAFTFGVFAAPNATTGANVQTFALTSSSSPLVGIITPMASNTTGGAGQPSATSLYTNGIQLVPIPETSTSLLGAIGALALLRRRRN